MVSLNTVLMLAKQGFFYKTFVPHGLTRDLTSFLDFTLVTMVGGEILAYILKQKTQKKTKLANGHLINENDVLDILGNDGLILSKDIQLKRKYDYEGSAVFGATGSGKTTGFYIPNLLNNNLKGSIVVNDPSNEIFEATSWYQKNICHRKILRFAPLEPNNSEMYNLLSTCRDNDEVKELSSILLLNGGIAIELSTGKKVGGAEWLQMSEGLLSAALIYSKDLGYPYDNVEFALRLIITMTTKELDLLFSESKDVDCKTEWATFKIIGGADRTEGSIKITLSSNLRRFTDKRISQVNSITTFNFEDFRKEPTILYICYPEHKSSYISPYTGAFLSRMLDRLIEEYHDNSVPIHCFFEEFCDIGMITDMPSKARTVRKREISLNICIQGLTQLYQIYGKDNGISILNNLKTKMIFPSMSDEEALRYISTLCGEKEIETVSKSENKSGTSTSYSKTKIKMFSESDLRCLNSDELLIVTSNKNPILSKQNTYFTNEKYTSSIKKPVEIEYKPTKRFDFLDYIEDLKVDLAISKEEDYNVREELFR
ncbi:MAG: type IV secretory system conjugative DNA transfer family protein [Bacillota bacterium]|nr:type IV secretory system conjugative DNA transfer family protein [Bacillota bacterium]